MSVYIRGMEMPKDCIFCPMFHGAWTICSALNKTTSVRGRPDDCPLVPVPPHGDLIDRDKISYFKDDSNLVDFDYAYRSQINSMPTIIEAEEGET